MFIEDTSPLKQQINLETQNELLLEPKQFSIHKVYI